MFSPPSQPTCGASFLLLPPSLFPVHFSVPTTRHVLPSFSIYLDLGPISLLLAPATEPQNAPAGPELAHPSARYLYYDSLLLILTTSWYLRTHIQTSVSTILCRVSVPNSDLVYVHCSVPVEQTIVVYFVPSISIANRSVEVDQSAYLTFTIPSSALTYNALVLDGTSHRGAPKVRSATSTTSVSVGPAR